MTTLTPGQLAAIDECERLRMRWRVTSTGRYAYVEIGGGMDIGSSVDEPTARVRVGQAFSERGAHTQFRKAAR